MRSGIVKRNCENKNKSYQYESNLTYMIKMNKITIIMIKKQKKKTNFQMTIVFNDKLQNYCIFAN